jgi:hypothetical protein
MAAIKTALPAGDIDRVIPPAAVIPASFHIPAPAPIEKHPAGSRKMTKRHTPPSRPTPVRVLTQLQQQRAVPQMVMAKAVEATTGKRAAPAAQMVVFVETAEFGYGENLQTNAAVWKTQVWHIVLIAPAASQVGVTQSSI